VEPREWKKGAVLLFQKEKTDPRRERALREGVTYIGKKKGRGGLNVIVGEKGEIVTKPQKEDKTCKKRVLRDGKRNFAQRPRNTLSKEGEYKEGGGRILEKERGRNPLPASGREGPLGKG